MELSRISLIPESGTPLQYLNSLSTYLGGPKTFIKREDLNGCLTLVGNKLRKLEYLLKDALDRNCNVIVTTGDFSPTMPGQQWQLPDKWVCRRCWY